MFKCLGGEIGKHKGFKIPRVKLVGSSPTRGTKLFKGYLT